MRWRSALLLMLVAFLTNPNAAPGVEAERSADDVAFGLMLVIIIFGLLFSPDFGTFMTILKVLVFIACLPAAGLARVLDHHRDAAVSAARVMTLYFAYGANMERAAMRKRCPGATALGIAALRGWRYVIARRLRRGRARAGCLRVRRAVAADAARPCGAQSVREPRQRALSPRDVHGRDAAGKRARALVYVGRGGGRPRPMPGYQERVIAPAADWRMPERYLAELRRLAPGYRGARPAETGEIG